MERDAKELVQKQFGRTAEEYVNSESHARGDDLERIVQWTQPQGNWTALDIATGGGHVAKTLAPHVRMVVATDLTQPMLVAARNHLVGADVLNCAYVLADAEKLPFLDDSFEIVVCRIAAHHFPSPQAFVTEAARVLKPGGRFVLIDNVIPEDAQLATFMNKVEHVRDHSHVRCLAVSEWKRLVERAGLHVAAERLNRKTHAVPSWARRAVADEQQFAEVVHCLQTADELAQQYYSFTFAEFGERAGQVTTFQVDEWAALCVKTEPDQLG